MTAAAPTGSLGQMLPFVGRSRELQEAQIALREGKDVVIDGPPRSGRTRLLNEIVNRSSVASDSLLVVDDADGLDASAVQNVLADAPSSIVAVAGARGEFADALRRRGEPTVIVVERLNESALVELLGDPALGDLFAPGVLEFTTGALESAPHSAQTASNHGDRARAEAEADRAWNLASTSGDPDELAAAALALGVRFGYVGDRIAELGRRAAIALRAGAHPPHREARLLARKALVGLDDELSARESAERAVALTIDDDNSVASGEALLAYAVTDLGPDSLDERIAMCRRVVAIAAELADADLASLGSFVLIGSLVESGDLAAVDVELAQRGRDRSAGAQRHTAWFRAMRAIVDGRIDDAEARCAEAREIGLAEHDADTESVYFGQLGIVRWLQGREHEVEPLYLAAREQQPTAPVWRSVLARLWALSGRYELAAATLAELSELDTIPRDRNWMLSLCVLAETAVIVGATDAARSLRAELLPYSGRLVTVGLGVGCYGSVARPLGLLARALGNDDEAEHHFRGAIALTSSIGARPWLAQAQGDLASLLREQGRPDLDLEAEAGANARLAGVQHLVPGLLTGASNELRDESPSGGPTVRVLGTFEVIDSDGERASWTSRKARELLKILVSRRGAAVARSTLLGLLWPDERPEDSGNRLSVALSTVRRTIDPQHRRPGGHYVGGDGESIWLETVALKVDVLTLLADAEKVLHHENPDRATLHRIVTGYRGPAFADDLDAEWAHAMRQDAAAAFLAAGRRLGASALVDDPLLAAEVFRKILAEDPYDEAGHRGVVEALERLGAHGRSEEARLQFYSRMADIGITVDQLRGI